MSVVRPFAAGIVRQDRAEQNVSPMFDALPASERKRSWGIDAAAYDGAAAALYVYRLRRGDEVHTGVVADVSAEAFGDGRVRGHESVQPDRVAALVEHFAAAGVRTELVALLHADGPAVEAAIAETVRTDPVVSFTGPDEWEQTVWRVPDAAAGVVAAELDGGVHYIADGHHRVAASLRAWETAGRPPGGGVLCVIYPPDGLRLLAFHRRVTGPVSSDDLKGLLAGDFDLADLPRPEDSSGSFAVYVDGHWHDATFRGKRLPGVAGLDVSVLNTHVLAPLLGSAARPGLEFAPALAPVTDLTVACDDDGGVLFWLRPPTLDQLMEVADRGEVMPPKTTYFDPKPYAGIFLR
ncbi:MAG: DUF1015 family protein [Marmoricola sp.]